MSKKKKKSIEFLNKYQFDAKLDFHDRGVLYPGEIEILLEQFLEECIVNHCKEILIITGKGKVVKPHIYNLLKNNKNIKSFKIADYFNGGLGAFEVLLK